MPTQVHSTAVIAEGAELGVDVHVGPYTVLGPHVRIGDRTHLGPQVVVDGHTTLGADNVVVGQASLGGSPQDKSYKGEATRLEIGDDNTIREFVTINRGTVKGGGYTRIGSGCLLMACCHVAHDCDLRDDIILANNVMLAGHVLVGRGANVSGGVAAHHFLTIGDFAYVGGLTRLVQDVPPYMIVEGHPSRVRGVNVVGLARAGFGEEQVESLRVAFRRIYRSGRPRKQVLEDLAQETQEGEPLFQLVRALQNIDLGAKGRHRESLRTEFARAGEEFLAREAARR